MYKPTVIVIAGPTASGKTSLGIELAKRINGEIISADSMQIYEDMDVGTAKPTKDETKDIKHYLIDFVSPDSRYSVATFKKDAESCIQKILTQGKIPIVVGGTGLYIDSLVYGIEYPEIEYDDEYRKELMELAKTEEGLSVLYDEAKRIDKDAVEKISKNDKKRIIRILEIYKSTGKTKTEIDLLSRKSVLKYNYKVFAIDMDRDILYNRINQRVEKMMDAGLIEEVKKLISKYSRFPTAMQGLGYKEVVEYLNNEVSKEEMIDKIKQETRRYAKRQLTWFRKNKNIIWIDGQENMNKNISIIINELNT